MKKLILTSLVCLATAIMAYSQVDFIVPDTIWVGRETEALTIGDVNNDGLNDALLVTLPFSGEYEYTLNIYHQKPNGILAGVPVQYLYAKNFSDVTILQIADMNNDNRNDVVISFFDSLGILYQNQNGTLGPMNSWYTGKLAEAMDTGDLNNDGLEDIAIFHRNDQFIRIFYQQPDGNLISETLPHTSRGGGELEVNDINGDGLDDIIYMPGSGPEPELFVYLQDVNNGILQTPVTYDTELSYTTFNGIATGDLNNDGRNDLVGTIGGNEAWIAIMYQKADGNLEMPIYLDAYDIPVPAEIADLNCDGVNEIIIGHDDWGHFSVWEQDENGNFSDYTLFESLYSVDPYDLAVGDLDNDGRKDILTTLGFEINFVVYNSSAPAGTPFNDTIVNTSISVYDTSFNYPSHNYESDTVKINDCLLKLNYEIAKTSYTIMSKIDVDSLFCRNFFMCGNEIFDTITRSTQFFEYEYGITIDSILTSTDTLKENPVYVGFTSYNDTTEIIPQVITHIDIDVEQEITPKALIIYIDTLLITSQTQLVKYITHVTKYYKATLCGDTIIDSIASNSNNWNYIILQSDTIITGHTTLVYPLGVDEYDLFQNIRIYPNPANKLLVVEIPKEYEGEGSFELIFSDLAGKVVFENKIYYQSHGKLEINTHALKQGIYLLKIVSKTKIGSAKVIISR